MILHDGFMNNYDKQNHGLCQPFPGTRDLPRATADCAAVIQTPRASSPHAADAANPRQKLLVLSWANSHGHEALLPPEIMSSSQ